ncbi:MAG: DUF6687 family protein [Pseudomonadota bacterium]|nr:DUF6687 family protein [Pseudomonadota bacterium]
MSANKTKVNKKLPKPARYFPYSQLGSKPNIIVDGSPQKATQLTLSHWPWSPTSKTLLRDTSTETVFAYIDSPDEHKEIDLVSNSHFDEDGVLSMYALLDPKNALFYRDLMIGASRAGDFGIYTDLEAAKLSFVMAAFADPELSPFPSEVFSGSDAKQVEGLYCNMLDVLPKLLDSYKNYSEFWQPELTHLKDSEQEIRLGNVLIDEIPDLDLAIISIPEDIPVRIIRRYLRRWQRSIHPFAVHNITQCSRLILIKGNSLEFQYRYESWVKLVSRRPLLRIDLTNLAEKLSEIETRGGKWVFEGVNDVAPRLHIIGSCKSSIPAEKFISFVAEDLVRLPVAWDPYNKT